jgi:rubrerythrin
MNDDRHAADSAVRELERDPTSRGRFLKMVGGAGAAGALSVLIAACGGDDDKGGSSGSNGASSSGATGNGSASGDVKIVNYALTLEYLEADFYDQVIASGQVKDRKVADLAKRIADSEHAHVAALKSTVGKLGGTPAKQPKTNFDAVLSGGPQKILETAAVVENLGAAAYLGQAGNIQSKEVLAAALSIHSVEARHAAALNTLVGKTVVPDGPFGKPASMDAVLAKVKPFIAA